MADVSAVINMTPHEILWNLALADGLAYQRERWFQQGVKLIRKTKVINKPVSQYFRG